MLVMDNSMECMGCTAVGYNSTHHQIVFYNINMLSNRTITISLNNMTNPPSLQPQIITAALMTNNLAYLHSNTSTIITNSLPSIITFDYQFSNYQYKVNSTMTISNMVSSAKR